MKYRKMSHSLQSTKNWIGCLTLIFTCLGWGQSARLIEKTVQMSTSEKNANIARKELIEKSSIKAAEQVIEEILGDKALKNKKIVSKIAAEYPKFIPFSKIGDLQPQSPSGFSLTNTYRVNVSDLESVLLENGLFYEGDVNPIVVPFVTFTDQVNETSASWWNAKEESKGLKLSLSLRQIEDVLRNKLSENGFFLIRPMYGNFYNLSQNLVSSLGNRLEDRLEFARLYGAQMILTGEVVIRAKQDKVFEIGFSLAAYQTLNKRLIAEVVRKFDTSPGSFDYVVPKKLEQAYQWVFQDLSSQIFDTWQRGTLGSSVYKLTLKGKLPLVEQEGFKELVRSRALEIKNIRERRMTLAATEYEFDSTSSPKEISSKLNNMELGGFKFIVEQTGDDFIQIGSVKR